MASAPLDFDTLDYYTEPRLINDPNPYLEHLRAKGPVAPLQHGAVAVTGFEEAVQVYTDLETYSSVNAVTGPFPPVPFALDGSDITDKIEAWRPELPMKDQIVSFDQPRHSPARSLMMRLFTPSRLKANEEFLWKLSDELIDRFWASGKVEVVRQYGVPFAGMVIADLLGVPEEDRPGFAERFGVGGETNLPSVESGHNTEYNPLLFLHGAFSEYLAERRRNPRQDILSELANGKFPDGSTPDLQEVVNVATFMFGAGQDTTARLLAGAMQVLAEDAELQQRLRSDPGVMDAFIEETLRLEGPVKTSHRLVKKRTVLGGVELAPGTHVALMNGAINRDPRRFENPDEFRLDRPKAKEHIGFGRGAHTCPGAPLARTETRVSLTRLLARMGDIRISDEHHGPPGARVFNHEPTYILRGLVQLRLEFTPVEG